MVRHWKLSKFVSALRYLEENGVEVDKSLSMDDVIKLANNFAFDNEVRISQERGTFYSFGGDDNCEGCRGWDGSSHRCDCGNRRVDWEYGGDFEDIYIYGQAY